MQAEEVILLYAGNGLRLKDVGFTLECKNVLVEYVKTRMVQT